MKTIATSIALLALSGLVVIGPCGTAAAHDVPAPPQGSGGLGEAVVSSAMVAHDPHIGPETKTMWLHMVFSSPRSATEADRDRAASLVDILQTALVKYKDYRVAEHDGYKPFHPKANPPVVHFTRWWYAVKASFTFNPAQPSSLLYKRTPEGGYKLIGAMYTAPKRASEEQLNQRVPLSIARWHRHVNLCLPARGTDPSTIDWTKFGNGSIATEAECDEVGGRFYPQLFGWMVHVYPWEKDPAKVWPH